MAKKTTKRGAPQKPTTTKRQTPMTLGADYREALARAQSKPMGSYWSGTNDGDFVAGQIVSLNTRNGKYGSQYDMVIEQADGTGPVNIGACTVINALVAEMELAPGQRVVVCYRGLSKNSAKGRPARLYTIERV